MAIKGVSDRERTNFSQGAEGYLQDVIVPSFDEFKFLTTTGGL
jgi:hypothetical protein